MKKCNIFLASSLKLTNERQYVGCLIQDINSLIAIQNIDFHFHLLKCESLNPNYEEIPKQSEYESKIPLSDIFIVLFDDKAGEYTLGEVNVAIKEFEKQNKPHLYAFFKQGNSIFELTKDKLPNFEIDSYEDYRDLQTKIIRIFQNTIKEVDFSIENDSAIINNKKFYIHK